MSIASYRRAVKPYRNTIKLSAPFGAGLDYHPLPPEAKVDAMPRKRFRPKGTRWEKLDLAPLPDAPEPPWDAMAGEALAVERSERGLIPWAVAEWVADESMVGH